MKTARLGDLVNITIGRTPSRSDDSLWDKNKSTSNVWLSIADMPTSGNRRISNSKEFISDVAAQSFAIVPKGTLLVSFKLTLGRLAYTDIDLRTNEAIAALRNDEKAVLNDYLYHYLSYFDWSGYASADQKVKGFTLNKAKLAEIRVVYPESFEDQRSTVARLDAAFDKIAQAEILMKQNIENVSFLQKSILAKYLDSANDTHTHRLGDICDFVRGPFGGTLKKDYFKPSGYAVYEQRHAIYGMGTDVRYYIDQDKFNEMKRFEVHPGDLIMSCSGTIGKVAIIPDNIKRGVINQALLKFTPKKDSITATYLRYLMESRSFLDAISENSGGSAIQNVASVKILKTINVDIPPPKEQDYIVEQIDNANKKISALRKQYSDKLHQLLSLRQSLLAEAFAS